MSRDHGPKTQKGALPPPKSGKKVSKDGEPWTALVVLEEDIMVDEDAGAPNECGFYFQSRALAAIELVDNESVPARYCVSSKNACTEWQCQSSRCAPWVGFWWVAWAKAMQRSSTCEKRCLCAPSRLTLIRPFPLNHNPNDRAPRYLRDTEVRLLLVKY